MTFPRPEPGLVIRYAYLWLSEYHEGRDEGTKDRPCAVVLSMADDEGETRVTVLPVTHTAPVDPSTAIELPVATKQRLGLDGERSWIVLGEGNEFLWPGPDVRSVPGANPASISYGFLPPGLFRIIRDRFLALARERKARAVPRTE